MPPSRVDRVRDARAAPMAVGAARRWVTAEWCFWGQLHGGRPHALWRMRAIGGMESEPTKTQLYERTSILRRATRAVLGDSRTVGGACRGICAGRVDVPCRLAVCLDECASSCRGRYGSARAPHYVC